uniref:Oogenesis-related gene n=1 Tax=Oryzias latipes TaxID=8090 RepID=A0A3P9JR59_ORYLA
QSRRQNSALRCANAAEGNEYGSPHDAVARRDGGLRALLRGLFWPFVCSRAWRLLAFQEPHMVTAVSAPPRPCRRKRLRRVTRALLSVLPRWVQSALGFPGPRSIGVALSPEIRSSPAKPDGKGSKRKQDDLDDDDDEEEEDHPSWVEALSKELVDDEGPAEDPDYEPSSVETDTEEYASHNHTESDLELSGRDLVIEDVQTVRRVI